MSSQIELTPGPLLDERGNLCQAGYAKGLVKEYDRNQVKTSKLRLKEWDYYLIYNACYGLALTIADNGYMGMASFSLLNFQDKTETTLSKITPFPMGKLHLPASSASGNVCMTGKDYKIAFDNDGKRRHLYGNCQRFKDGKALLFDVELAPPPQESMVIATPFSKKGHFYYNQKINCLPAKGRVYLGEEEILLPQAETSGILDWGRGVWTYQNTWYWSGLSGTAEGVPFGFNLGYGFGDTSAASENMLFYGGKSHKLSRVTFEIPQKDGRDDFLSPWRFTSDDGRFEADFEPLLDRAANMDFKVLASDQHQVFGYFTGKAVLDDGKTIQMNRMLGFAEKVKNKW